MRRTWRVALLLGGVAAAQVALFAAYRAVDAQRKDAATPLPYERVERRPGPALELEDRQGRAVRLEDLRGRPVLLHFWATWCPPCLEELPGLLATARATAEIRLVAVSVDEDWDAIHAFFDGEPPAEVVRGSAEDAKGYGVAVLPVSFLLDAEGRTVARFGGARSWTPGNLKRVLREAS